MRGRRAVVLARCLDRNDEPEAGLREYESLRRPRATAFVKRSRLIARLAVVRNPLAMRMGDLLVRRVFPGKAYDQLRRDAAYDVGAA